jgi:type IV secretion system protein VirB10
MSLGDTVTETVKGERDTSTINRERSLQSRTSSVLAIGLMSVLGLGTLTWYYATTMMRQGRARQSAQALSANRAQGEMALPSLGRITSPSWKPSSETAPAAAATTVVQSVPLSANVLTEVPVSSYGNGGYGSPPPKTPSELATERQLSGPVFAPPGPMATSQVSSAVGAGGSSTPPSVGQEGEGLAKLLGPTVMTSVQAQVLPTQRLLLPKGAFIDCTLETAIDSTLPGMTTCITATDTFGVDGKVVLLERGSKLVGETQGQVQQGSARVFVLWTEARTPAGVVVPLASPGTDELGRSGLPGAVNRHFWERFGAAILVSVIDGAVQGAVQSSRNGSGTVVVDPSGSQEVMAEALKGTINIPPTVMKQQGDRIQVLVARDLDFRSVYELRSVH